MVKEGIKKAQRQNTHLPELQEKKRETGFPFSMPEKTQKMANQLMTEFCTVACRIPPVSRRRAQKQEKEINTLPILNCLDTSKTVNSSSVLEGNMPLVSTPGETDSKESASNAGDPGMVPGSGKVP